MSEIVLSKRLQTVAELVPHGSRVADVGTDHGMLPVYLVQKEICSQVIASDVNAMPLEKAAATAERWNMTDKMDLRLCNGLEGISNHEVDTVIVAGMGGDTIADILESCPWAREGRHTFLLQPMSSLEDLRRRLYAMELKITGETLVEEASGVYSVMTVCGRDAEEKAPWEQYISKALTRDKSGLFSGYLERTIKRIERARDGATASKKEHDKARAQEFLLVLDGLYRLREELTDESQGCFEKTL